MLRRHPHLPEGCRRRPLRAGTQLLVALIRAARPVAQRHAGSRMWRLRPRLPNKSTLGARAIEESGSGSTLRAPRFRRRRILLWLAPTSHRRAAGAAATHPLRSTAILRTPRAATSTLRPQASRRKYGTRSSPCSATSVATVHALICRTSGPARLCGRGVGRTRQVLVVQLAFRRDHVDAWHLGRSLSARPRACLHRHRRTARTTHAGA